MNLMWKIYEREINGLKFRSNLLPESSGVNEFGSSW